MYFTMQAEGFVNLKSLTISLLNDHVTVTASC